MLRVPFISRFLLTSVLAFVPARTWAAPQIGLPVVRRYDADQVQISGAVLAMAQGPDGTRWVGSNVLAVSEGSGWQTLDLPRAYAFRGIAPDTTGRVWIAAVGALGYFARDQTGHWRHTSLLEDVQRLGISQLGDVWHVYPLGRGAVFITTTRILRWNGSKFDHWQLPSAVRLQAFPQGDDVLIYQAGVGLLRLRAEGQPSLELPEAALPRHPMTWQIDLGKGDSLLGLEDHVYRRSGNGSLVHLPKLSEFLRNSLPSSAVAVGPNLIAVGTFKKGVVFATREGDPIASVGGETGLGEDTVYSLTTDSSSRLWVGLNSGRVSIESPDRVTALDARSGFRGTPLKVLSSDHETFHILTRKTVYEIGMEGTPRMALEPQPLFWDAAEVGCKIWAGAFGGLWRLDSPSPQHEYHVSADISLVSSLLDRPQSVLFVEGYQLKTLDLGPYGWVAHELGQEMADTPLSLVEGAEGDIWVSTLIGGIYRYAWSQPRAGQAPTLRRLAHFREGHGLPNEATRPRLYRLGDRIIAFSSNGILQLNHEQTAFERVPATEGFIGRAATAVMPGNEKTAYWLVQTQALGPLAPLSVLRVALKNSDNEIEWEPIELPGLATSGQVTSFDFTDSPEGGVLWIGNDRELLRFSASHLARASDVPSLQLLKVRAGDHDLDPARPRPTLQPNFPNLTLSLAPVRPASESGTFYQTRLDHAEPGWSKPTASSTRDLTGLSHGPHVFAARAIDRFGQVSPALEYNFVVATPWYLRPEASVGYIVIGTLGVVGLVRLRSRKLQRQNERLNRLVAERTRELELSNTAKSEFLENVSHEIRNPLNGLSGMLELLQEEELNPPQRTLARSLKACADHLSRVSEQVLGYSKLEYGYVNVEPAPFQVRELLGEITDLFSMQAAQHKIPITVEIPHHFVDGFVGDAEKIKVILSNFLANALKYAPRSPIEVNVEAQPYEGEMIDLFFEVTDHGPGVPANEQELIFQKFVRGSAAKNANIPGTGLGLATCRVLAKAMNGSVGLESPPSGGATFYLRVLVARLVSPPPPATELDPHAQRKEAKSIQALIVEDEPYNQTVLRGVSLHLGFEPTIASNGAEALAAASRARFDVVFLDWELPGQKGGEVARELRGRLNGAHPIIIATTAHDSDDIRRQCIEVGMDGFLLKPYSKERIQQTIEAARARRSNPANSTLLSSTEVSPSGLNLEAFTHYARGKEKEADAVRDYVEAIEIELRLVTCAEKQRDLAALASAAHRLRALAGLTGAKEITVIASKVETLARQPDPGPLRDLVEQLSAAWSKVKPQLA